MKGFYYDIFLMMLTYGILIYLCIRLMKKRKRKGFGGSNDGGWKKPDLPIYPDLPTGVVWPDQEEAQEEILI